MSAPSPAGLALAVLNPGGRDAEQSFATAGSLSPQAGGHPPVNYHAYAACTGGGFYREAGRIPAAQRAVLLLLRRDLKKAARVLETLQAGGKTVAVVFKEAGRHQVAALFAGEPERLRWFREICARADFCLASTPDLLPLYHGAGARRALFLPTPYPVDLPEWDFSQPPESRRGIFIGTREFEVPSRNHLAALLAVRELGEPVTVINRDGRAGRRMLEALGYPAERLRVVEGPLPYPEYLRLMAGHRLVFQLDRSGVPGQVAGDALLCRVPCVGGDGAVDQLAYPWWSGGGAPESGGITPARRVLGGETHPFLERAQERLSFAAIAASLRAAFAA